jgi:uncharacterized protein
MKVILIGATGQVGYALAPALIEAGHEVTVLVRDASRVPGTEAVDGRDIAAIVPSLGAPRGAG